MDLHCALHWLHTSEQRASSAGVALCNCSVASRSDGGALPTVMRTMVSLPSDEPYMSMIDAASTTYPAHATELCTTYPAHATELCTTYPAMPPNYAQM